MDLSIYHRFYEVEDRHWWFVGRRAVVRTLLVQALGRPGAAARPPAARPPAATTSPAAAPLGPRRLLDVGCGTGGMLPLLSEFGAVTGIDSEPVALDYCRRRGFTDLHLQEAYRPAAPFDVITLFDVLEHVPDDAGFLAWVASLLAPGGRLILTVPAGPGLWSRHDDLNHHQRRYTRDALVAALRGAGFTVERATHFNFWLYPVAAAARRLDARKRDAGLDPARDAEEILKPLRIGLLNAPLTALFSSEAALLKVLDLPIGVSIGAVARR